MNEAVEIYRNNHSKFQAKIRSMGAAPLGSTPLSLTLQASCVINNFCSKVSAG